MRASSWTLPVAVALATSAGAQPATTIVEAVPGAAEIDRTTTTQDLAFKIDSSDRMTVPVRLGGKGPYRFLVDTGADRTAVSTKIARDLGLVDGPMATLHSVTGTSSVRTANVPQLELTHNRVRSVEAPLLEAANMGADGILGVDSLRSQRVLFDFKARMISIVPSAVKPVRDDPNTIVIRGKLRRGHLIVTRAQADGVPVTVVLDTGSEMTIGNTALWRKLEARRKIRSGERVELTSVTGQKLLGNAYPMREVRIGEVALRDMVIVFGNAQIFRSLDLEDQPTVLLGMNAMRAFDKVSIDFERKKLRLVVPQESSIEAARMATREELNHRLAR